MTAICSNFGGIGTSHSNEKIALLCLLSLNSNPISSSSPSALLEFATIPKLGSHSISKTGPGPSIYHLSPAKKNKTRTAGKRTMGQGASQLGSEEDALLWEEGKKMKLHDLLDSELEELLETKPLSLKELRDVGWAIQKRRSSPQAGYYSHDADGPEAQLAARLNAANTDLAKQRFKLVPSKLKEPIFWEATILLVRERLVEHNERCRLQLLDSKSKTTNGSSLSKSASSSSIPDDQRVDEEVEQTLYSRLALREFEITALKEQISELQELLLATTSTTPSSSSRKASQEEPPPRRNGKKATQEEPPPPHNGKWIMAKDSKEFLEYPEEVKSNMRGEKQRRLRQMRNDMKFILDSDNIADTNGHWDCCGAQSYQASCGFGQQNGK